MYRHGLWAGAAALTAFAATAAEPAALKVTIKGLDTGGYILPQHTFCQPDPVLHTKDGGNVSPEIAWEKGPEGTRSYALIMHDPDVPTVFDDANQPGKTLPDAMPRTDFTHWVLVDIPASVTRLPEGADSDRLEREGKRTQQTRYGLRGLNDYGHFMKGEFFGYDGSCPPWNDERLHHYTFTVYALDVPSLKLAGRFGRQEAMAAMAGHILAQGQAVGLYTQNPQARNSQADKNK